MDDRPRRVRTVSSNSSDGGQRARVPAGRRAAPTAAPFVTVASTEAQNEFGRILDQAAAGQDVAITRHNVERAVLVSAARYRQLVAHEIRETPGLDLLAERFEELFASLQTPEVREANARALRMTHEEMGRAAVEAAWEDAARAAPTATPDQTGPRAQAVPQAISSLE